MSKSKRNRQDDFMMYDEDDFYPPKGKKKEAKNRRPVKNWKNHWLENEEMSEERDEFFN